MSHDKVKAAARRRAAATGEPYAAARRHVISGHDTVRVTSAISADDIRAAADVQRELGPDYSDAVVASFIDQVDRAVAARVEARLADQAPSGPATRASRGLRPLTRRVARDVLAASAGALVAVGAFGLHEITGPHPAAPASRVATGLCTSGGGKSSRCVLVPATRNVRTFLIKGDGQVKGTASELVRRTRVSSG